MATVFKLILKTILGIFMKAASKAFIEWIFFYVAEQVVKSTKTPHDDEFLRKLKEANKEAQKDES